MHVILIAPAFHERQHFQSIVSAYTGLTSLSVFSNPAQASEWMREHPVDIVFMDTDLPEEKPVEAAKAFIAAIPNIRIVFLACDGSLALDAWQIGAAGFVLKPYTEEKIVRVLERCGYQPLPSRRVAIQTMPSFSVTAHGKPLHISAEKPRELFALLVDAGERGLTTSEGIACLWPDRENDKSTQALFRMTYKRLVDILEEAGIADVISSRDKKRFLMVDKVDCDLYHILSGDRKVQKKYAGQYLQESSWAEDRNAQLYHMLMSEK